MDPVTHVLSGTLLARATAPTTPRADQLPTRTRVLVGAIASAFPDIDFVWRFIDPLAFLAYHRAWLNSVVLWPFWALLLALLFSALWRHRYGWRAFAGVCFLVIGLHIFMDFITSFGSMIFSPISYARLAWSTTFIIDPYLMAIVASGLVGSLLWRASRAPALSAVTVLALYIGAQGILHERALAVARQYANNRGMEAASIHALPQPFSPFNWMLVVVQDDRYHLAYVSLLRKNVPDPPSADAGTLRRAYAAYRPAGLAQWQEISRFGNTDGEAALASAVWHEDALRAYRAFALFPALYRIDNHSGTCVWFRDLRFALVGRAPPFVFGLCRNDEHSRWRIYRLTGDGKQALD
jgi:inner membrane protein